MSDDKDNETKAAQSALQEHRRVAGNPDTSTPKYGILQRIRDFFTDKQNQDDIDWSKVGVLGGSVLLGGLTGFASGGGFFAVLIGSILGSVLGALGADPLLDRLRGPRNSVVPPKWDEPNKGTTPNKKVVKGVEVELPEVKGTPGTAPLDTPDNKGTGSGSTPPDATPEKVKALKVKLLRYDPDEDVKLNQPLADARAHIEAFKKKVLDSAVLNPIAKNEADQERAAAADVLRKEMTEFATQANQKEVNARYAASTFLKELPGPAKEIDDYFASYPDEASKLIKRNLSLKLEGDLAISKELELMGKLPNSNGYDLDAFGLQIQKELAAKALGQKVEELDETSIKGATALWDNLNVVQKRILVSNYSIEQYKKGVRLAETKGFGNRTESLTPDQYWEVFGIRMHNLDQIIHPSQYKGGAEIKAELDAAMAEIRKFPKKDDWWDNPAAADAYLKVSKAMKRVAEQQDVDPQIKEYAETYMRGAEAQSVMIRINHETKEGGAFMNQWKKLDDLTKVVLPKKVNTRIEKLQAFQETKLLYVAAAEKSKELTYDLVDVRNPAMEPQLMKLKVVYQDDANTKIDKVILSKNPSLSADDVKEISGAELGPLSAAFDDSTPYRNQVQLLQNLVDKIQSGGKTSIAGMQGLPLDLQHAGNSLICMDDKSCDNVIVPVKGLPQQVKSDAFDALGNKGNVIG